MVFVDVLRTLKLSLNSCRTGNRTPISRTKTWRATVTPSGTFAIILGLMAKNKTKQKVFVIFTAIITTVSLAGLTGVFTGAPQPGGNTSQANSSNNQPQYDIPCSTSENFHTRSRLTIIVDGKELPLPANIGVDQECTREIHTHNEDGIIHIESAVDRGYTFADFLNVLGITLDQQGYTAKLTVNGAFNDNDPNFKLEDGQEIILEYITLPIGEVSTNSDSTGTPEIAP